MATAPKKRGPGRPALIDRESIVAAALAISREDGPRAVTMSGVAKRLGVGMPALYYHLRNLDELLAAVAEVRFAEMPVPDARLRWDRWLVAFANEFRALLQTEPLLVRVPYLSVHQPFPALVIDRGFRVLTRDGFSPLTAQMIFGEFLRRIVDLVYAEHARAEEAEHGVWPIGTQRARAATVTREQAPHLYALIDALGDLPDDLPEISDYIWEWNLCFELDGIRAMLGRDGPSPLP